MATSRMHLVSSFFACQKVIPVITNEFTVLNVLHYHTGTVCRRNSKHFSSGVQRGVQPLSPAVRQLVDTNNIDVTKLTPTGPKNRLLKIDVLNYLSSASKTTVTESAKATVSSPSKPKELFEDIPLTNMRKTIAKRLTESKATIPYSYSVIDCKMNNLLKLREEILREQTAKVSVNDLIVKAVGLTLRRLPECNGIWADDRVKLQSNVDVSIAVATKGGLITPIIEGADALSIMELSANTRTLAKKARDGQLQPHEYQGGTFCVSNLGMYGISEFTAIINPPQAAILAVGGVKLSPYTSDNNKEGVAKIMSATLSHDCRVIDYELAAKWLTVFKNFIENPSTFVV